MLLAVIVLFSTVSFTIEKHYCGDFLIDTAVFTKAKKCASEMPNDDGKIEVEKKHCCKDEVQVVLGQDELKFSSFEDVEFQQIQFIASFVYSYVNLYESLPKQVIPHKDYSPPNITSDIHVLNEVFII